MLALRLKGLAVAGKQRIIFQQREKSSDTNKYKRKIGMTNWCLLG